MLLRNLRIVV